MDTIPSIDTIEQWQLLRSICPVFESDLDWKSLRSEKVDVAVVEDTAKFLKFFIAEIKIQVPPDYVLSGSTHRTFLREINSLLSTLETLVKSSIEHASCDGKPIDKDTEESFTPVDLSVRCPKLIALAKLTQNCNQISLRAYDQYLYLVQDAARFKEVRYELQSFIETMQKTLCQEDPYTRNTSTAKPSNRELKSRVNRSFWNYSKRLFDSLVTHLQPCTAKSSVHRAMLHLKGLTDMNENNVIPELSILLACCPDQKTWQQTYCSISSESIHTNRQTDNICQLAQESYKRRAILKIELNCDRFLDMSDLLFAREPDYFGADPTVSLNDLLKLGLLKDPYKFYPNDKKILAYILAQALLCLYEGPWLQTLWTLDNLLYRCHATDATKRIIYNIHQPYISCVFLEQPPPTGTLDYKHRYPLILSFAKLLVELETGKELEAFGGNEKSEPSLLNRLLNYSKTWSKHQLSRGYANALDACIMFQKYFKEDQMKDPQITIQEVILKRIVHELEIEIDLNQKKEWGLRHLEDFSILDRGIEFRRFTQDSSPATHSVVKEHASATTSTTSEESIECTTQNADDGGQPTDSGQMRNAQGSPRLMPFSLSKARKQAASQSESGGHIGSTKGFSLQRNLRAANSRLRSRTPKGSPSGLGNPPARSAVSNRSVTSTGSRSSMRPNQQHHSRADSSGFIGKTSPSKSNKSKPTKDDVSINNTSDHRIKQTSYSSDVQANPNIDVALPSSGIPRRRSGPFKRGGRCLQGMELSHRSTTKHQLMERSSLSLSGVSQDIALGDRMCPKTRDEFDIAIICALPIEADAVRALFDETYDEYGQTYGKLPGDSNIYTTGRIDQHNIVLCHLPRMGTSSAASVASSLPVSYTRIQLTLVVGICGAVPFPSNNEEIILGDIIISDSVIKYDFGRQYPDGFQRKTNVQETLGRPNREIQGLLEKLKTRETKSNFQNLTCQYLQTLQMEIGGGWQYPGVEHDVLFKATYPHKLYQDPLDKCICFNCRVGSDHVCDETRKKDCNSLGCAGIQVQRARVTEKNIQPFFHIGKIASADTVMKSGEHRDELAKKEGIIGFEMEGAGVWDNVPCLIIKGVCDYADSHKNKMWQAYAAATAASGAKALLKYWVYNTRKPFD